MSDRTSIEWTDATWNPTRGCSRVSAGCDHCYAMREARRHDHPGGSYEGLTRIGKRGVDWSGVVRLIPAALDWPLRYRGHPRARAEGRPSRVFTNSMSDLFHESLPDEAIAAVFGVMAAAPRHIFQVLTKRPARMQAFMEKAEVGRLAGVEVLPGGSREGGALSGIGHAAGARGIAWPDTIEYRWPLPNVWLGCSVEDQATADERIPLLLQTPAAVRFVSYEPALGPVDFSRWLGSDHLEDRSRPPLGWLICGGESGPGARPFDVAWARSVVAQCEAAGVPIFMKQMGAAPYDSEQRRGTPLMRWYGRRDYPVRRLFNVLTDRKGGDMAEWSPDLRVREFPHAR